MGLKFILSSVTILIPLVCSVDFDYVFSSLRSQRASGCSDRRQELCELRCGPSAAACSSGRCRCVDFGSDDKFIQSALETELRELDFDQAVDFTGRQDFNTRPILRHHIAHFCPNLDIARDCIRSCMKVGKPAFCGKDHACYCGHRYTNVDRNEKINASDVYNQFRDLYTKYFGPNTKYSRGK